MSDLPEPWESDPDAYRAMVRQFPEKLIAKMFAVPEVLLKDANRLEQFGHVRQAELYRMLTRMRRYGLTPAEILEVRDGQTE